MSTFSAKQLQSTFIKVRNNRIFEHFIIFVIIFSALLIGVKTHSIPEGVVQITQFLDFSITVIFLIEIIIRFFAEDRPLNFFKNGWNIFDSIIVIVSLIPLEDSEIAFIGRLIRIFRVLRMVSIIPELRMLLNSLLSALPQLGYVMALMFIIFYIYAAIGTTFFATINHVLWGDISISMLTLFRVMTFEDWTDVMYETMGPYPLSWIYYLSFIFFTAFAFLNMVIGIVVNVINEEHENMRKEEETENSEETGMTIEALHHKVDELQTLLIEMHKERERG